MANTLTAFNPEYWAGEMQKIFFKESVALVLANTELRELLSDGDTVNKPFRSEPRVVDYTKGTDITVVDRSATNEQLVVNTAKVVPFYVDDLDAIQNKWDTVKKFAQDAQIQLNTVLDQVHMAEVTNADSSVDDGDLGGTAGNGFALTVSNVNQMFTSASRKLDALNIPQAGRYAVVGSRTLEILRLYLAGRDTGQGDLIGMNGLVMERFGFQIFYSNNVYFTATLAMANIMTDTDTVTIAGVVMTADADGAAVGEGHFSIQGSVDLCRAQLTALINDSGTVGVDEYIDFSDADRFILENNGIVATNDNGNDVMTIIGHGDIVLSETFSDGTDEWTATATKENSMFGLKGAVDMVIQKSPNVEFRLAEKRLGRYVYPWMLYGKKTFDDGDKQLVKVVIAASSWL